MAYIIGSDRYQTQIVTTSLDDLIDSENPTRAIDAYVNSLNLRELGFVEQVVQNMYSNLVSYYFLND